MHHESCGIYTYVIWRMSENPMVPHAAGPPLLSGKRKRNTTGARIRQVVTTTIVRTERKKKLTILKNIKTRDVYNEKKIKKHQPTRRTNERADGRGHTSRTEYRLTRAGRVHGGTTRYSVATVKNTNEGITKQVPDRSASAGTGYWFWGIVVVRVDGGRQMQRRAGDDLYGAVGGE